MNRQSITISAALLAVVVVVFGYFVMRGGDDSRPAPITGPGRAAEARSIIQEFQEQRGEQSAQPTSVRQPVLLEQQDAAAAQGATAQTSTAQAAAAGASTGATAVTPAPTQAAPTGQNAQLDEAFERAADLQAAGQLDDAQMLYFFAARQGHARSAYQYAELNDPLHHSAASSLLPEPDPNAAFRYYRIALDGGYEAAAERLDALHQWTIDAAAAGDIDAEMLLVQWEQ